MMWFGVKNNHWRGSSISVKKVKAINQRNFFLGVAFCLMAYSASVTASDFTQAVINGYLSRTILSIEAEMQQVNLDNHLEGLDAWVDETELTLRNKDFSDFEDKTIGFEVSIKNSEQVAAEREILRLGSEKNEVRFNQLLLKKIESSYFTLVDLIEQEMRESLLNEQHRLAKIEVDSWKTRINSEDFRAEKLQQADLSLDSIWAEELENHSTLKRYRATTGTSFVKNQRANTHNLVSISQMLKHSQEILQTGAFERHNTEIRKTRLSLKYAQKEQQRDYGREKLSLSKLKIEYDDKDNAFGASVSVRIPITKNSFETALSKQDVYYSTLETRNKVQEIEQQLTQKHFMLQRYQDESASMQKLLHKISLRMKRIRQPQLGQNENSDLLIDLKAEQMAYQKRQNEITIKAYKTYIGFLSTAGILAAKPYRNWLQSGAPQI